MSVYAELGVKPIINAAGTVTAYSGTLMHPEVTDAMNRASREFVIMEELHIAAGKRIAELIGVEAAHVCSSATAGVALMGAACIAGADPAKIKQLPDTTGMKYEFIVQECHRNPYEQAIRVAGGKMVEIRCDAEELKRAINPNTAGVFHTFSWLTPGNALALSQVVEIAHAKGVPVIVDSASELPPADNLTRFVEEGADLVVFSGGKGLRGPQSSGLLMGRADLIEACRLNDCPNSSIGRGMKTGKEDIVGLVKAVDIYVHRDHAVDMTIWEGRVARVLESLAGIKTLRAWRQLPYGTGQLFPYVALAWDEAALGIGYEELMRQLKDGPPRIIARFTDYRRWAESPFKEPLVEIYVHCLREGEEYIVAKRVRELLTARG